MSKKTVETTLRELLLDVCHIWSWTFSYEFKLLERYLYRHGRPLASH
ncbi:MAG: hypothetical protein K5682_04990 [Lachnospiraceae bacterium]|nr:hypothetical protein [Lachnospiraceae bacterium]